MDPQALLALPPQILHHRYARRDTILYALGIGAGQSGDAAELPFVLEDRLAALPTMAVILAYPGFWQMEPRYGIDWRRVLHAEQSCEFHAPLPAEGAVRGEFKIDAIVDKGADKGALLRATRRIFDEADGRLLATVRQISFLRGDGGKGGGGETIAPLAAVPDRSPDRSITFPIRPEQALLYRLSGDYNPLHADPAVAEAAGFPRPILHGLCTYGFAGRLIIGALGDGDAARLRRLECRFTAPVFPGETVRLELWREAGGEIAFRADVPARGTVVLDRGRAAIAPPA